MRYLTTVTHLDMHAPFAPHGLAKALPPNMALEYQPVIALKLYRQLYDAIGRQWHWVNRRDLSPQALTALIHHPTTEIYVLRQQSRMLGFIELNFRAFPQVEIIFIGLTSDYIGRGLGATLLAHGLERIYCRQAERIIIQTCTLDHPSALYLYQKAGFLAYKRNQVTITERIP